MYLISPFSVRTLTSEGGWQVFTPIGVTRLNNQSIVGVLNDFTRFKSIISHSEVCNVLESHQLPVSDAIDFLKRIKIIKTFEEANKLLVISPSLTIAEQFSEILAARDAIHCRYCTRFEDIGGEKIVVAIQDAYDGQFANRLYEACEAKADAIILHSYFVLRHFIIDGFYSKWTNLPDHYSGLYNLAGLERASKFKPASWADFFFSDLYSVEMRAVPTLPLENFEISTALFMLRRRLLPIISEGMDPLFSDDLSTVTEINLDTGTITHNPGMHSSYSESARGWK